MACDHWPLNGRQVELCTVMCHSPPPLMLAPLLLHKHGDRGQTDLSRHMSVQWSHYIGLALVCWSMVSLSVVQSCSVRGALLLYIDIPRTYIRTHYTLHVSHPCAGPAYIAGNNRMHGERKAITGL